VDIFAYEENDDIFDKDNRIKDPHVAISKGSPKGGKKRLRLVANVIL